MAGLLLPDPRFRSPTVVGVPQDIVPFVERYVMHSDHTFKLNPGEDRSITHIAVEPSSLYTSWDGADHLPRPSLGNLIVVAENGRTQFRGDLLSLMDSFTGISATGPDNATDAISSATDQVIKHLSARSDVGEIGAFFSDLMARYSRGSGHIRLKPPILCARNETLLIRAENYPTSGELAVVIRGLSNRDIR
jgi:hypothetical protein